MFIFKIYVLDFTLSVILKIFKIFTKNNNTMTLVLETYIYIVGENRYKRSNCLELLC